MRIQSLAYSGIHYGGNITPGVVVTNNAKVQDSPYAGRSSTEQKQREIQALKQEDQAVRNHEQAHISAAAGVSVSSPHFTYITGPDGKQYAVGGEVSINTASVPNDPQATLRKSEIIRRAALAPANPSAQDFNVAAQATQMENHARMELLQQHANSKGSILNLSA